MIELMEDEHFRLLQTTDNLAMLKAYYDAGMPREKINTFDHIVGMYETESHDILVRGMGFFCKVHEYELMDCDYEVEMYNYIRDHIKDHDYAILFEHDKLSNMSKEQFEHIEYNLDCADAKAYRCDKGVIMAFDFLFMPYHSFVKSILDVLTQQPKEREDYEVYANVG